jgi:hypothetical protein
MDLHGEIMNIQSKTRDQNVAIDRALKSKRTYHEILVAVYQYGHRDARHAAAELVVRARKEVDYEANAERAGCT